MSDPVRILLAKSSMDGHDRGIRYMARKFRDAGFEVIFTNFLRASEVVATALEEDVQAVGVSSSSGGHLPIFKQIIVGLEESGLDDVLLLGGGIIPAQDRKTLKDWGVAAIFGPGATAEEAIALIQETVGGAAESAAPMDWYRPLEPVSLRPFSPLRVRRPSLVPPSVLRSPAGPSRLAEYSPRSGSALCRGSTTLKD